MISAVNGRKRALLTKSGLEWHNKRCTAQSTLCVGNKKGKTELKAMCDWYLKKKKKKKFFFFFLVSRYLGHDTIHVSPAQVSRCIDASMHRYALTSYALCFEINLQIRQLEHAKVKRKRRAEKSNSQSIRKKNKDFIFYLSSCFGDDVT